MSADEISAEYGLLLAEIYAVLSYYFDHQDEINESIREDEAFVEEMRKQNSSVLTQKGKAKLERIVNHYKTQSEDDATSKDETVLADEKTIV